jgi:hypothetical protein
MRMCFLVMMEAMGKKKVMTGRGGLTLKPGSRLSRLFLIRPAFLVFGRSLKRPAVTKGAGRGVSNTVGRGESQALKSGPHDQS